MCPCWQTHHISVAHLHGCKILLKHQLFGYGHSISQSQRRWWWYLNDPARRAARRSHVTHNQFRLKKALHRLKQAPWLSHNDINPFLLSHTFTQSQANPNLYHHSDGILMLLYVDDISMMYPKDTTKAAIEVMARLRKMFGITNLGVAGQFLGIKIHCVENSTGISLGQKAFITSILKRFKMQNAPNVSTPLDGNVKLDPAENWGEKELQDIKGYQAIISSLMYMALATQPDISFTVAALWQYNSCPFTSHLTAAKWVL